MSAPKLPRLEMVKVPDWNSSGDSCLARARFTRSAQFRLICASTALFTQLHVATYPVLPLSCFSFLGAWGHSWPTLPTMRSPRHQNCNVCVQTEVVLTACSWQLARRRQFVAQVLRRWSFCHCQLVLSCKDPHAHPGMQEWHKHH